MFYLRLTFAVAIVCAIDLGAAFLRAQEPSEPLVSREGLDRGELHGHLLQIPFPLMEVDDRRFRLQVEQIIDRHQGPGRPIVVMQFVRREGLPSAEEALEKRVGRGTEFERSLSLARWLLGPSGVRARTVAYLPESIEGHAVLVALACEEIAMAPLAELGRASLDEASVDQVVLEGYLSVAQRRGALPSDAVRSMLDREASLYRVELVEEQIRFVSAEALEPLRKAGHILTETQLSIPGQLGSFTGQEMRSWRWITHLARDEEQLKSALATTVWQVASQRSRTGPVKPALIEIRGAVNAYSVNRWLRAIDEAVNRDQANLLILHLQSPGGDFSESLRLAELIVSLDATLVESVAWVEGEARGDAALIGLACDSLMMKPGSILGGPGEATIDVEAIRANGETWRRLAQMTDRTEGEWYGLISPDLSLHEYLHPRKRTEIGEENLFAMRPDFAEWKQGRQVSFPRGMMAEEAAQRGWASGLAANLVAVAEPLGVTSLPLPKRVTRLEQWIRSLADQEWLATLLLTMAIMLFTNELTTPGLGLAGFLSLLCMALFFWMKFLDGTVEWLEITLCVGGLLALGLEIFVLPGFGVFGFGGMVMLAAGIILASQTFVVPTNEYQWGRLASNTGQIAFACIGMMVTVYLLRHHLERLPFFRMLKLEPPSVETAKAIIEDRNHLIGLRGMTVTRCAPFGKALIGDQYWEVDAPDDLIPPDTAIEVTGVRDRTILVRRLLESAAESPHSE